MEEKIRLQKYLASMGIASRRKCEEYITQGKIKINGQTVTELGIKVDPNKDKIEYNGKEIKNKKEPQPEQETLIQELKRFEREINRNNY